jgi:AraC family transcriptional regulator, positive regulator of tynA and feaB
MAATFTTEVVPEHEREEYWQEVAGRVFLGLRTERKDRRQFFGTLEAREVGRASVALIHSSAQDVFRGEPEIASAPRECFYIGMQLDGVCMLAQAGQVRQAHPGDIELLDSTQPGALSFDADYRRIIIAIPYHELQPRLDGTVGDVARGQDGMGALASTYVRAFAHSELPVAAGIAASDILVDLLALTFNAPVAGLDSNTTCMREARRTAIRAYVERNLADPSIAPATATVRRILQHLPDIAGIHV